MREESETILQHTQMSHQLAHTVLANSITRLLRDDHPIQNISCELRETYRVQVVT